MQQSEHELRPAGGEMCLVPRAAQARDHEDEDGVVICHSRT